MLGRYSDLHGVVQTIDMADVTVALDIGPGGSNTRMTGAILFVDPNSGGASEILKLPPEADCVGLPIDIFHTGGEGIVVKDDSGGTTIATIATGKSGRFATDGTSWKVLAGA